MKKALLISLIIFVSGCENQPKEKIESNSTIQLERDLEMYRNVWNSFLAGDTSVVNDKNFTEDIIIVTSEGDIVGIEACLEYYSNYLTGFSEIQWTIVDAFGQGNKLIKHWNFKESILEVSLEYQLQVILLIYQAQQLLLCVMEGLLKNTIFLI